MQAARDVGLNYRTLARALDEQTVSRVVREALLAAHRAESAQDAQAEGEADEELARRLEAAESQLGDTLDALGRERERADELERRLELVEERQAGEPGMEVPARTREMESQEGESRTRQEADAESAAASSTTPAATPGNRATADADGSTAPEAAIVRRGATGPAWSRWSRWTASGPPSVKPPSLCSSGGGCGVGRRGAGAPSTGREPRSAVGSWSSRCRPRPSRSTPRAATTSCAGGG